MTSGSHGKPYSNWSLPDCAAILGEDGQAYMDTFVRNAVGIRVKDRLSWLMRGGRRTSDEHASGTSGSEDHTEQDTAIGRISRAYITE
jgi:hypothetical protein